MSRGLGKLQKELVLMVLRHVKPMTFDDIRAEINQQLGAQPGTKFGVSFERSLRRALHRLTQEPFLIAMGDGGRGNPYRYCVHPMFLGIVMGKKPEADAYLEAIIADKDAEEAIAKAMKPKPRSPPDFLDANPEPR